MRQQKLVIGFKGYLGSGKTTCAKHLLSSSTYRSMNFVLIRPADPLRKMLRPLLSLLGMPGEEIERHLDGDLKESVIPALGVSGRSLQQTLGTQWGRQRVRDDLWVMVWQAQAEAHPGGALNDSVRFLNEAKAVRDAGGVIIEVVNPRVPPKPRWGWLGRALFRMGFEFPMHASERIRAIPADYVIVNDGSIDDLLRKLDGVIENHLIYRSGWAEAA